MEGLSEEERRALRGSKFAPLPPPSASSATNSRRQRPRMAHPGGPIKTNTAAALAKFLERKLQYPEGLTSINPDLLHLAVNQAKRTVLLSSGGNSETGSVIRHVTSFGDSDKESSEERKEDSSSLTIPEEREKLKKIRREKKLKKTKVKKNKKQKIDNAGEDTKLKRPKKKLKL